MFRIVMLAMSLICSTFAKGEQSFVDVVSDVTKSVGAIGLFTPLKDKAPQILGTGFVIGDGSWALTNYHVVDDILDPQIVQHYVLLLGEGQLVKQVKATVVEFDPVNDIALLKLSAAMPDALRCAEEELRKPGTEIAFTGFPIGAVLGLYPATHRGYISAITPDAIPVKNANQLSIQMLQRLSSKKLIYQLDAVAYPGNSGSPLFDPKTGRVLGMINKVLVKDTKESALSSPTGISYAIPLPYILALADRAGLDLKTKKEN